MGNKKLCASVVIGLVLLAIFVGVGGWLIYRAVWSCSEGMRLEDFECKNIDECQENTDDCSQICHDTSPGFDCSCESGYRLLESSMCFDIDECREGTHDCDQECINESPDYKCACRSGYQELNRGRSCKPICSGGHSCGDRGECVSPNVCKCNSGYTGDTSGCNEFTCGVCENGHCTGPNECSCDDGYRKDNGTCQNINECEENTHNCSQVCRDTSPGYECACYPGYRMSDNSTCDDVNECEEDSHNCEQLCNNTTPFFKCLCNESHELMDDGISCKPVCSGAQSCGRGGECYAPGKCRCYPGYNGTQCQNYTCDPCENGECVGPNQCSCNGGFQKVSAGCQAASSMQSGTLLAIILPSIVLIVLLVLGVFLVRKYCRNRDYYIGSEEKTSNKYCFKPGKPTYPDDDYTKDESFIVKLPLHKTQNIYTPT